MFPDGTPNQPPTQQQPGTQAPAQQSAPPPQQFQQAPPPQAPAQQQFQQPPAMPIIPSPHLPQRQAPVAPQQQTPAVQPDYSAVINSVASALGTTPDIVRQQLGDNPVDGITSLVRDAAGVLYRQKNDQTQVTPASPQQQTQLSPDGKIPLADGWQNVVQRNAQGVYEPIHAQYKQYADAANHNAIIDRKKYEQYQADPTSMLEEPSVKKVIQDQIKAVVQAQVEEQRIVSLREEYRTKFGKDITQVDERGVTKIGMDGKPIMTPLGFAFAKHVNALAESGMKESARLYESAMTLARNDLGIQGFAAGVQQQPQQTQPMQGQPYYQQQQQPQPQTTNLAAMLQQNSQQWYPGTPPSRQPVQQPTIEGALYQMLSDLPDGQSIGAYLDQMGPLFTTAGRR